MTEREQFEAWWRSIYPIACLDRGEDDCYIVRDCECSWRGWQAARAAAPAGLSLDQRYWAENRSNIIGAIAAAGFEIVSNKDGFWLRRVPLLDEHFGDGYAEAIAAAPAEPTRSAEPVAWMHVYKKATGGAAYSQADIGEHGPDPEPGFVHVGKDPLYAHPPRSAEWVAEAMRLFDQAVVDAWNAGEEGRDYIADVRAARAALEAHLTSSS